MKNLSIRSKFLLVLFVVAATIIVTGTIGAVGMIRLNVNELDMYQANINNNDSNRLTAILLELRIEYRQTVVNLSDPEAVAESIAKMNACDEEFASVTKKLESNLFSGRGQEKLSQAYNLYHSLQEDRINNFHPAALAGQEAELLAWLSRNTDNAVYLQAVCDELAGLCMDWADQLQQQDARTSTMLIISMIIFSLAALAVVILLGRHFFILLVEPIKKMAYAAEKLAVGDVDVDIDCDSNDEIGLLSRSFHNMITAIQAQAGILDTIAHSDFDVGVQARSDRDIINCSLENLVKQMNDIMMQIRETSEQVFSGSEQIAQSAQSLAAGSSEQAATVQQFSASLAEILNQTKINADGAAEALDATYKTGMLMEEGSESMRQMLGAMESIDESSKNVARVIKVIEDIAFQTNILALNAAVEAARAGQHGKGFAVVADEVRNLASKSAAAARETSELIDGSLQHVEVGNTIVKRTNDSLHAVTEYAQRSLKLIHDIAEASSRQTAHISEIDMGIDQILKVVQENSSTSEQSAAAAQEMSTQAEILHNMVKRFKLKHSLRIHRTDYATHTAPSAKHSSPP